MSSGEDVNNRSVPVALKTGAKRTINTLLRSILTINIGEVFDGRNVYFPDFIFFILGGSRVAVSQEV